MKTHLSRDIFLENFANKILRREGYSGSWIYLYWNNKFRTTAGWVLRNGRRRIHLNPILKEGEFRKHLMCTLKHELAHVLAYHRAGRRQIQVHGLEWKKACRDFGIPKEKPRHDLAFRGINVKRKFFYYCPNCGEMVGRVKPFKKPHACIACCIKTNKKAKYDRRFQLRLVR